MQKREMEEAKSMSQQQQQQQQQQQLMLQQQHQQQQQLLLLQQLQKQQHQQSAISRFPSNIDAHLRPPGLLLRPQSNQTSNSSPNPNSSSASSVPNPNPQNPQQQQSQQQQSQQQKAIRPNNQAELQMAYQDAWRVCHPDFKRPFTSLEDACERLLPYHVVADYEAEEDDRILDSDTTGQMPSRSQQWDHNIAVKVAEFTATFEKQALAFNIITRKRAMGEFRSEERLMVEQALLQDEKRAMLELRAEIESREKASRDAQEAKLRMAAMVQAEQARAESQARAPNPIRASALSSQGSDVQVDQEQNVNINPHEMINGWGNNAQRDEKEPSDDFLNDEETENGDTGEWRESGEFDLNTSR